MAAGSAIVKTADVMLAKGKKIASGILEASEVGHSIQNGNFEVVGTDRRISLFETARRAKEMSGEPRHQGKNRYAADLSERLHIAEVEIDPDTGEVDVVTYTAVDDCGNMLNPMVVEGQVHGT